VQQMSLAEIIRNFNALKKKAKENTLAASDMKDSTITISNYGVLGGAGLLWATPTSISLKLPFLLSIKSKNSPWCKTNSS